MSEWARSQCLTPHLRAGGHRPLFNQRENPAVHGGRESLIKDSLGDEEEQSEKQLGALYDVRAMSVFYTVCTTLASYAGPTALRK